MSQEEDFLVAKTIPACYFVHLEASEFNPGYWLNFAHVTEVIVRLDNTVFVKLLNERSYCFTGQQAQKVLEELKFIQEKYGRPNPN